MTNSFFARTHDGNQHRALQSLMRDVVYLKNARYELQALKKDCLTQNADKGLGASFNL